MHERELKRDLKCELKRESKRELKRKLEGRGLFIFSHNVAHSEEAKIYFLIDLKFM